jgi:rhodanese-related sulfurtransferase
MVGLGVLDFNQVWVNPTYLWPGIVGGLIMGVGFVIGGFCPGTSLVAAATFKLDGVFFVLGGLVGIFLFGETVVFYEEWWNSSYFGRLTIMDWLDLPTGVVVIGIVLMALFMFWGGEQLERKFGAVDQSKAPSLRLAGAGVLLAGAVGVLLLGQPTTEEKWTKVAPVKEVELVDRAVQIHPGELLTMLGDNAVRIVMLDVRPENEFNLFHLRNAQNVQLDELPALIPELHAKQALNTVFVTISNDEAIATEAWKVLTAESIPNAYILEGGINNWLTTFGHDDAAIQPTATPAADVGDTLDFTFFAAMGDRYLAADPNPHEWELEYTPKIKLEMKRDKSGGGCG